jgi:sirohydrochlorin cobaltochelatase
LNFHSQAALILVGHGSTVNPDSSAPTHLHADSLRARGIFREVVCCFWKEEPSMREVFESVDSEVIYIVPNFISEGYFCQQVLPRELRLDGPVTRRDGREIYYCDPVGIHPNMTRLLLQRADEVAAGVPRSETSLIIVGHGTNLNENSTKAIQDQVRLIREGGYGFAEVVDAYMEEAPYVADWHQLTSAPNVVVVPFFIADGLHSYQDIPVLLGLASEPGKALSEGGLFFRHPVELHGRTLFYSGAIGTEPLMAEVILDQVVEFDRKYQPKPKLKASEDRLNQALVDCLAQGRDVIGQIKITSRPEGGYVLCHVEDVADLAAGTLRVERGPAAARDIARYNAQGEFRPLKTAPNLSRGWCLHLADLTELRLALDFFYPAALGMAQAEWAGQLQPVPLRDLFARQTGMYRHANRVTDAQADEILAITCESGSKCLRRIVYPLSVNQPLGERAALKSRAEAGRLPDYPMAVPLLCMEACNHVVSVARKVARDSAAAAEGNA